MRPAGPSRTIARRIGYGIEHALEWHVADIGDSANIMRAHPQDWMKRPDHGRCQPHSLRSVARTRTKCAAPVLRHANECDVEALQFRMVRRPKKRWTAHERRRHH